MNVRFELVIGAGTRTVKTIPVWFGPRVFVAVITRQPPEPSAIKKEAF
jgi:hypothetical protein